MLFLEISLVAFLLKENYSGGMEALLHNFIISGILVGVDVLLKVIYECTMTFVSVSMLIFRIWEHSICNFITKISISDGFWTIIGGLSIHL